MASVTTATLNDEVLTGEAVALDLQPLGFVARATGAAIDVVATVIIFIAAANIANRVIDFGQINEQTGRMLTIVMIVFMIVIVPTTIETLTRGRSLGKLIMGGRIVRTDGGTIGFRHAFLRSLVGVVELWMTVGSVAILTATFAPRAQRLGDLVAGTYAERVRTPPMPPTTLTLPVFLAGWAAVADVSRLPDPLARKLWQFSYDAAAMQHHSRMRIATGLLAQVEPYVHPMPPADPLNAIAGIMVVRRDRELRALQARSARAGALLGARR